MTIYRANCKNIFIYLASDWTVTLCLVTSYDAIQSYNPINPRIVSSLDIAKPHSMVSTHPVRMLLMPFLTKLKVVKLCCYAILQ